MDNTKYLLGEYKKANKSPVYIKIGSENMLVPVSYDNVDTFLDDLFAFQDKECFKFDRYNLKNPENQLHEREITVQGQVKLQNKLYDVYISIISPLKMVKRNYSDSKIASEVIAKAVRHYNNAIKKTARLCQECPQKARNVSLTKNHLDYCFSEHLKYITQKVATKIGKAVKWSAEKATNAVVGVTASPLALAYKILDKKHRISISPTKKKWIDEKAIPYIKKGVKIACCKAMLLTALLGSPKAFSTFGQIKDNKAKKEAFFDKYDTTNKIFYQNYKTAKENEAMIVALIACPEGFRENAYLCSARKPTKGYGTTRTIKKDKDGNIEYDENGFAKTIPVVLGTTTTKEDGYEDVVAHLEKYVYPQLEHINKTLESQEIAAVCMFIYNTDEGAFKDSMLCAAINNEASDEKIREAFSIIRSVGGIRSYGLINRHGFEGYVFCCENIEELINIKPTIAGSPDIKYYKYGAKNKKDPLQNSDKTFVVRDIEEVMEDAEKFKTNDYKKCIVFMLPQEKATEILEKFGYYVDEQGNLKKDITWEEAQEISSKSTKKQEKKNKNKKQSVKQSKLTYKTNKNTGRK